VNEPGIDAGAGIAIGTNGHGKIFAEARYSRTFMGNFRTDHVPITFLLAGRLLIASTA